MKTIQHSDSNARKIPSSGAFVTFFKSLFGSGLLALPNVLGRVGLVLGVVVYFIVAVGCALSCYLLLRAREVTSQYLLGNHDQQLHQHHLVTYGDLADILLGHSMAKITRWSIIVQNVLFTAGLIIVICENLSDIIRLWTGNDEQHHNEIGIDNNDDLSSRQYIGLFLFPIVVGLLQIPWLQDMWYISALGLFVYAIGVIGSTLYSAFSTILVTSDDATVGTEDVRSMPNDIWEVKWDGVRTFVGSAVYALEGINLAMPTVHSMRHPSEAKSVVCGGILLYGCLTLIFAAVGYAGGLGGGPGTGESPEECDVVTKCITPQSLETTIQVALSVAMLLSVPVMLYPSTEMLEVMLTDRRKQHIKEMDCGKCPTYLTQLSLVEVNQHEGNNYASSHLNENQVPLTDFGNDMTKEMTSIPTPKVGYASIENDTATKEDTNAHEFSQDKSWTLRIFLAVLTVGLGTVTKSFTYFSGFVGAVCLSFVGFVLPPLLYFRAMEKANLIVSRPMQCSMMILTLFGYYSIVIGGLSSFGDLIKSF
mmetsp:Transcript_24484/g.37721  ORF Transcript_24484/g.37721 Transcript_24484/m.37721 type:complete len:535 (+) Transcript_24484:213-1817(+)